MARALPSKLRTDRRMVKKSVIDDEGELGKLINRWNRGKAAPKAPNFKENPELSPEWAETEKKIKDRQLRIQGARYRKKLWGNG